jgi:SAM-dependent methyltransferase
MTSVAGNTPVHRDGRVATRGPYDGVMNIVRFNWPFFVAAELAIVAGVVAATALSPSPLALGIALLSVMAMFAIAASLLVSHVIYDRSDLYRMLWLPRAVRGLNARDAVYCQTGFDDASLLLQQAMGDVAWTRLDHHDPVRTPEASIRRARRVCPPVEGTKRAPFDAWPMASASTDVVFGMLAIHELRRVSERAAWFAEARRVLRPGGRVVIVEHVRDLANLLAFGPGVLHFHSPAQWEASWQHSGLRLHETFRVTPWVRVFVLAAS